MKQLTEAAELVVWLQGRLAAVAPPQGATGLVVLCRAVAECVLFRTRLRARYRAFFSEPVFLTQLAEKILSNEKTRLFPHSSSYTKQ